MSLFSRFVLFCVANDKPLLEVGCGFCVYSDDDGVDVVERDAFGVWLSLIWWDFGFLVFESK